MSVSCERVSTPARDRLQSRACWYDRLLPSGVPDRRVSRCRVMRRSLSPTSSQQHRNPQRSPRRQVLETQRVHREIAVHQGRPMVALSHRQLFAAKVYSTEPAWIRLTKDYATGFAKNLASDKIEVLVLLRTSCLREISSSKKRETSNE